MVKALSTDAQPKHQTKNRDQQIAEAMQIVRKFHEVSDATEKEIVTMARLDPKYKSTESAIRPDEECLKQLAECYQDGNTMAFQILYSLLIPFMTYFYNPLMVPQDNDDSHYTEYMNTAWALLMDSVNKYKRAVDMNGKEVKFTSFIGPKFSTGYIYGEMNPDQYHRKASLSRINKMLKFIAEFERENNREPTVKEISKFMKVEEKTVRHYLFSARMRTVSLYQDGSDDNGEDADDYIMDIADARAEVDKVDNVNEEIARAVLDLPKEEAEVIIYYAGFREIPGAKKYRGGYRQEDVCNFLNISPSKFKKRFANAKKALKLSLADYVTAELA